MVADFYWKVCFILVIDIARIDDQHARPLNYVY